MVKLSMTRLRSALRVLGSVGVALLSASVAFAHTPYLKPATFSPTGDFLTVEAAFAEEFFTPDVAMRSDAFGLILPSGQPADYATVTTLRAVTVMEAGLPQDGTYRLTSGERLGRVAEAVLKDGELIVDRREAGATDERVQYQSVTRAEAYVTKGAPTDAVLASIGQGIEFVARTHPSSIFVGEPARFQILFDGQPLPEHEIVVYRGDGRYADQPILATVRSDAEGAFQIAFDEPGVFLAVARHRTAAPAGAETPYRSYTYALTLEADR